MIEYREAPLPNAVQVAKELLLAVGNFSAMDGSVTLSTQVLGLAGAMADSDDLKEFYDGISDIFADCLSALPAQVPVISTLASLLSGRGEVGPLFGARVLDRLVTRLAECAARGDVLTSKLILRSFACLASSGCLTVDGEGSLCALLDILLDIAYAAWDATGLSTDGRAAIYLLAHTLPWALGALMKSDAGNERIRRSTPLFARVVSEWKSPFSPAGRRAVFLYDATPEDAADESAHISLGPAAGPVSWDTLWEVSKSSLDTITKVQSEGAFAAPACMSCLWDLPEVASELAAANLAIDAAALDQLRELASNRDLFSSASSESSWLRPCFSIFDSDSSPQAAEVCAQLTALEKTLALDYCRDVSHFFSPVIRFNGTRAGTLDTLVTHLVALHKLYPACPHFQYVLVEALFAGFVSVPADPAKHAFTGRVLLELCRKEETVRPVVALGASVLFAMASDLDSTVWRALAEWLGFHLVNTKVSWPYWPQWAADMQGHLSGTDDSFSPENMLFLTAAIQKSTRVLQPDIVSEALPEPLTSLVPGLASIHCSLFAPLGGSAPEPASERAQELQQLLHARVEADEVEQWVEALALGGDEATDELLKIKILIQALFEEGKGALSVFTSLVDRYGEVLRMYTDGSPATKLAVVQYVEEIFSASADRYRFILAIDCLVRKGIISVDGLAAFVVSSSQIYGLSSNLWTFQVAQLAVDRSVDILQASVKLYSTSLASGGIAAQERGGRSDTRDQDDDDVAVIGSRRRDEDEDEDEDSGRRGREEVDADAADAGHHAGQQAVLSETAKEALMLALANAGSVYSTLLTGLFSSLVPGSFPDCDSSSVTTAHKSAALSLIMYVSRTLHDAHRQLLSISSIAEADKQFLNTGALKSTLQSLGTSLKSGGDVDLYAFFQKAVTKWECFL